MKGGESILRFEDICKVFNVGDGKSITAADHVSFEIHAGETVGIVGESGSGKSTLAKMLTRMYNVTSGHIYFHDKEITNLKGEELRQHRKQIQMVFQDPSTAFNPKLRVREIICEPLQNFGLIKESELDAKAREMLELVDLPGDFSERYPNNMSGGQRQRVAIARALVLKPEVIICDEATSALDMSVQKTVIELLARLQKETNVAYMFICHDLALANMFCDHIVIMQHGKVVEQIDDLNEVTQPYSKKLLASIFDVQEGKNKVLPDELFA